MLISRRKASVWYLDFAVGLILFSIATIIFFSFSGASLTQSDDKLTDMMSSLKYASSALMTQGYPDDWNSTNVQKIGITDGTSRIDEQKLSRFQNLDQNKVKVAFNSAYKYHLCFKDYQDTIININGEDCIGDDPENSTYQVTVHRLVIYNDSIVKMEVSFWE